MATQTPKNLIGPAAALTSSVTTYVSGSGIFTYDAPFEPTCTGPSEMRHDHEMTIMVLHSVNRRNIDPLIGAARAAGPLIIA